MPDDPCLSRLAGRAKLPRLAQLPARINLRQQRRRGRAAAMLLCVLVCAVLLHVAGCGVSVKPRGQVVTDVSVGR